MVKLILFCVYLLTAIKYNDTYINIYKNTLHIKKYERFNLFT